MAPATLTRDRMSLSMVGQDGSPFTGSNARTAFSIIKRSLDEAGFVLSCEIEGAIEAAVVEAPGLISGHLYSILMAKETVDGRHQLIKIRNPW